MSTGTTTTSNGPLFRRAGPDASGRFTFSAAWYDVTGSVRHDADGEGAYSLDAAAGRLTCDFTSSTGVDFQSARFQLDAVTGDLTLTHYEAGTGNQTMWQTADDLMVYHRLPVGGGVR